MQVNVSLSGTVSATRPADLAGNAGSLQSSFPQLLESMRGHQELSGQISALQARVLSGNAISPRELLIMQVQMGRFSMQVELVSRMAESVTVTLKRLQSQQ